MKNYDSLFCLLLFRVAVAFGQQVPEQVFPDEPIEPLPVVGPPTFDPTAPGIAHPPVEPVEPVEPVSEVVPIAAPASPAPVSPVNKDLTELPPPPPPEENIEEIGVPGDTVGQIDESNGEYLIRDAAINDIFQMLAKRANKQYFHNVSISGSEFNVSGHLNSGNPLEQMEELAFQYGLTLYTKGNTVYALNSEQLNRLPAEEWHYQLRYLRPTDI